MVVGWSGWCASKVDDECQKGGTTHKVDEPHNTKHHTTHQSHALKHPSMCHQSPHWPHQMPPPLLQSTINNKKEEGRRTDCGTKEQVDTTTKVRQHNGHLHGWLGVEPSATTHGHHNQHHHTSTAKACGSSPTPTQPHNSHQPWSPHSTTTMVWSSSLVCE